MADPDEKWSDNNSEIIEIKGKKYSFYCDSDCILCTFCSRLAPNNFKMSEMADHDICFKQPQNEEELHQCIHAMENCPVDAIGLDGYLMNGDGIKAIPQGQRFSPSYYEAEKKKSKSSIFDKVKNWFSEKNEK